MNLTTHPELLVITLLGDSTENEIGCMIWNGARTKNGYGELRVGRTPAKYIHRLSYEHFYGPIPDGMVVDHLCNRKACWNPDHLRLLTRTENTLRAHRIRLVSTLFNLPHDYVAAVDIMREKRDAQVLQV